MDSAILTGPIGAVRLPNQPYCKYFSFNDLIVEQEGRLNESGKFMQQTCLEVPSPPVHVLEPNVHRLAGRRD